MSSSAAATEGPTWRSERWHRLTRRDLTSFDDHATSTVLAAMERGGVGRISTKGHAILRNPKTGETMGVAPSSNKSKQVIAIRLRKLFPESDTTPDESASTRTIPAPREPINNNTHAQVSAQDQAEATEPTLSCTNKRCDAVFVTEGARYSHVNSKHVVCAKPGCLASFDDNRARVAHEGIVHEGRKPRAEGKAKAAAAAATIIKEKKPVGFNNMSREERQAAGRKGAEKRWAKVRAAQEAAAAQAVATQPTEPPTALPVTPVGEHTPAQAEAPRSAHSEPTPLPFGPRLAQQVEDLGERMSEVADWVTKERGEKDARIAELEAEVSELRGKLARLRTALDS